MARPENIAQWRTAVFTTLLSALRPIRLIAALPSAAFAMSHDMPMVALMEALALIWIQALWRFDTFSYTARVYGFLALLFGVGIGTMVMV